MPAAPKPARQERKPRKHLKRSKKRTWRRKPADAVRIYGSPEFREHVHASPCLWCGVTRPIVQAHFGKKGTSQKTVWRQTGPLCDAFTVGAVTYPGCHARLDRREMPKGVKWFGPIERMMLATLQRAFIADWDARSEVVLKHVSGRILACCAESLRKGGSAGLSAHLKTHRFGSPIEHRRASDLTQGDE